MNIGNLVNQINNAINQQTVPRENSEALKESLENGLRLLMDKGANFAVSGKILSVDKNMLLIDLGNNALLQASMEQDINPQVGQTMSFAVKGADTGKITLSLLFENTNQQSTVNMALKEAGIPQTPENQFMVKTMMEEGLPIDKDSLFAMSRAIQQNSAADIPQLAKMARLDIPLTPQMVETFKEYENAQNQISGTLEDIVDATVETLEASWTDASSIKDTLSLLDNLKTILLPEGLAGDLENIGTTDNPNGSGNVNSQGDAAASLQTNSDESNELLSSLKGQKDIAAQDADILQNIRTDNNKETATEQVAIREQASLGLLGENENIQTSKSSQQLLHTVFDKITQALEQPSDEAELRRVFDDIKNDIKSDSFKEALKNRLNADFFLKPEEVAQKEKISELYEKLESHTKAISNLLEQTQKTDTPLAETINNVNRNLDFMNQLNQTFNYIQLPLKMAGKNANGELYVYSNKKSLSSDNENVSALLHLDMDNLGTVDVHVMMSTGKKVSTKFFLKDDEALDLVAANIDLLNKRLEKRGYSMNCEFVNNSEPKSVFETILEDNKNISVITSGSFDARA